jgi:hypothetical protein
MYICICMYVWYIDMYVCMYVDVCICMYADVCIQCVYIYYIC